MCTNSLLAKCQRVTLTLQRVQETPIPHKYWQQSCLFQRRKNPVQHLMLEISSVLTETRWHVTLKEKTTPLLTCSESPERLFLCINCLSGFVSCHRVGRWTVNTIGSFHLCVSERGNESETPFALEVDLALNPDRWTSPALRASGPIRWHLHDSAWNPFDLPARQRALFPGESRQ